MERNDLLLEIVERDYNDYTELVLEQYFRQKIAEEERVTLVGNYWDRKGMNEINLVALNDIDKTALVAEVKHIIRIFTSIAVSERKTLLSIATPFSVKT